MQLKTLGNEEEIKKFIKSIKYDEGKMKIENKKERYVAVVVMPTHKDMGKRLKSLLNKYCYEELSSHDHCLRVRKVTNYQSLPCSSHKKEEDTCI